MQSLSQRTINPLESQQWRSTVLEIPTTTMSSIVATKLVVERKMRVNDRNQAYGTVDDPINFNAALLKHLRPRN